MFHPTMLDDVGPIRWPRLNKHYVVDPKLFSISYKGFSLFHYFKKCLPFHNFYSAHSCAKGTCSSSTIIYMLTFSEQCIGNAGNADVKVN